MAKVKKTLALEIISFKHPQTNETALVRTILIVYSVYAKKRLIRHSLCSSRQCDYVQTDSC